MNILSDAFYAAREVKIGKMEKPNDILPSVMEEGMMKEKNLFKAPTMVHK